MAPAVLLLASASPRRRELLTTLGIPFEAAAVDADEGLRGGEAPEAYLERVVAAKLALARPLAASSGLGAVLVADTSVVVDGRVLGKPADQAENRAMIASLAGRWHQVMTRFWVEGPRGEQGRTVTTRVRFRALGDDEIEGYAASGEGRDKAGGYAVQGLGSFMIASLEGSYSNVVGLPTCEVVQALLATGVVERFPLRA